MKEIITMIITALLSGLVGVLVGCWLNYRARIREEKLKILKVMITYQFLVNSPERIIALNSIPVVFEKQKEVCECFENFKKAHDAVTATIGNVMVHSQKYTELRDSYVKLMESIARSLHYKNCLSWDKLKNPYIPKTFTDSLGNIIWY